jgi:hypothetical protein
MVGLFVPDDMSHWPRIDLNDPLYQRDLASLQVGGDTLQAMNHRAHTGAAPLDGQMDHGQMDHGQMDPGQMQPGQMDHRQMQHDDHDTKDAHE